MKGEDKERPKGAIPWVFFCCSVMQQQEEQTEQYTSPALQNAPILGFCRCPEGMGCDCSLRAVTCRFRSLRKQRHHLPFSYIHPALFATSALFYDLQLLSPSWNRWHKFPQCPRMQRLHQVYDDVYSFRRLVLSPLLRLSSVHVSLHLSLFAFAAFAPSSMLLGRH